MGVLFKEHAVSAKAQKTKSGGLQQHHRLRYTWNPAPAGVTGVDVSRWAEDGTRLEGDAAAPAKIAKPAPSWAWPGEDGQRRDGVEQWVTEMNSVVDEMFEAVPEHAASPSLSAGNKKLTASSGSKPEGGGWQSARENLEDASLLGRSRVAAGVVGLRRYCYASRTC